MDGGPEVRAPWPRQMYKLASVVSPVGTAEESMLKKGWVQPSFALVIFLAECHVNSNILIVHVCSLSRWFAFNRV